jgi:hypothetical protein
VLHEVHRTCPPAGTATLTQGPGPTVVLLGAVKRNVSVGKAARQIAPGAWLTIGSGVLFGACSLQDLSYLRDDSLFLPDAGGGRSNASGSGGGIGNAGAGSPGGSSSGAAGTPSAAGTGGVAGAAGAGSSGASGSSGSGSGGVGGSAGTSGSGGVGGAAGFVGTIGDAGPDTNVVVDPGFESGLSNWTGFGTGMVLTWESAGPLAGTHCLHAGGRSANWMGPSYPLLGVVTPGATYLVSAWVRTVSPVAPMKITAKYTCTGDAEQKYSQVVPGATATNYWQRFEGEVTVPAAATCTLDTYEVYVEDTPALEDLYLDEFRIELIAEPPP